MKNISPWRPEFGPGKILGGKYEAAKLLWREGVAQRPVWHVNEPNETGARSTRARTRGQNPLVLGILSYMLGTGTGCLCCILSTWCPYSGGCSFWRSPLACDQCPGPRSWRGHISAQEWSSCGLNNWQFITQTIHKFTFSLLWKSTMRVHHSLQGSRAVF